MRIGYMLSSEEYGPAQLVEQARLAERAGFTSLWISDHFHPWIDAQGHAPFVWSMIGALSQAVQLPIGTAVTCPTTRINPAIIAQAAATSAVMTDGRFTLGVGTGEALNEHILGQPWPPADVRREMLAEAIDVMRKLWTGENVTHRGRYYTVENAKLYTCPDKPPPVYMSAFGPKSTALAADIADGYVNSSPDPDAVQDFRDSAPGKPTVGCAKGCWAPTAEESLRIAHKLWPSEGLPGELNQLLPTPQHFEQATQLVPLETKMPHGPDPQPYLEAVETYRKAGYDEMCVAAVGPHYKELIDLFARHIIA
jgi:G6PDH family F420-dependent oxidoreductase